MHAVLRRLVPPPAAAGSTTRIPARSCRPPSTCSTWREPSLACSKLGCKTCIFSRQAGLACTSAVGWCSAVAASSEAAIDAGSEGANSRGPALQAARGEHGALCTASFVRRFLLPASTAAPSRCTFLNQTACPAGPAACCRRPNVHCSWMERRSTPPPSACYTRMLRHTGTWLDSW